MSLRAVNVRVWAERRGLDPNEAHEMWAERAAIREYLGGYTRAEAELLAESDVVRQTTPIER